MIVILIVLVLIAVVAFAGYMIFDFVKDIGQLFPMAKEYTAHFAGENVKNTGASWMRIKWLLLGALVMFMCIKLFFISLLLLASIVIQAIVIMYVTRDDHEHKEAKRTMYALGAGGIIFIAALIMLCAFGESQNPERIVVDFVLIAALVVYAVIKNSKFNLLRNASATRRVEGTLKAITTTKNNFLLFTYATSIVYEYEFKANGIMYKGLDAESARQKKKRGTELTNPVHVVYMMDAPEKSRLTEIAHRKSASLFVAMLICVLCIAAHCVFCTDFLQTVQALYDYFGG